jgi:integrase
VPEYSKAEIEHIIRADEFERIYRNANSRRDRAWLVVLYLTGCRPSEALSLTKKQITIDGTHITFRIETKKLAERKNRRFMVVKRTLTLNLPHHTHYIRTLESYLNRFSEDDKLFPFTDKTGYNIVSKVSKKAIGKNLCPYNFRHSRMTVMAEAGKTDEEIMRYKGARSIRSVRPYVHAREVKYEIEDEI